MAQRQILDTKISTKIIAIILLTIPCFSAPFVLFRPLGRTRNAAKPPSKASRISSTCPIP